MSTVNFFLTGNGVTSFSWNIACHITLLDKKIRDREGFSVQTLKTIWTPTLVIHRATQTDQGYEDDCAYYFCHPRLVHMF